MLLFINPCSQTIGDTLTLGIDETSEEESLKSTERNDKFLKIKAETLKLDSPGSIFFPNVFSRAIVAKTYLVSQIQCQFS